VFISRLINDVRFRKAWIERRVQKEDIKNTQSEKKLLNHFIKELELVPTTNIYGKPVIRIFPKRFHGKSCHNILAVDLKHITTCLSLIVDEAAERIIHGYSIVNVLGSLFGKQYKEMVTRYVIKRLNEDLGWKNGR
jgi:hypothetical protein